MNNSFFKTKNICVFYEKKEILQKINLNLNKGEKVLLIGPNGAGKSTLLKCIAGIVKLNRGKIFFKGIDISKESVFKRVKRGIVYLKQEREIFPRLTVKENLEIAGYELKKKELQKRLDLFIKFFPNIEKNFSKRAGLLSGGERRALGILMVLIKLPELLLLDEPTAGLAPKSAQEILEKIDEIQTFLQVTILMVEHNLHLATKKVDKVLVMKKGKIVFEEDLKNGKKLDIEKLFSFYF